MSSQQPIATVKTELISLAGYSLGDLRTDRSEELAEAIRIALRQVERPRVNLGATGPPGRAD